MKLIVEMEMPRACPCELATEIEGNFYPCFAYYGVVERAVEFDKCMRDGKRPDWCPIKGVLPDEHGDLIDRDVLYMAVKSHNTSDAAIARNHNRVTSLQNLSTIRKGYIAEKHICLDDIIRAEAVIKAERKDDGDEDNK